MGSMSGRIAVVTGASRGIGRGVARALGASGATVYVTGRTVHPGDATVPLPGTITETAFEVSALGGVGIPVRVDHQNDDDVRKLFEQVADEQGQLDLLVNNAWAGYQDLQRGGSDDDFEAPFWRQQPTFWDAMFTVGVRSHYVASTYAAPLMTAQKAGLIANVSYYAGGSYHFNVAYGVAKAAVDRMTADMALELRPYNVAVISLWPGTVRTEMNVIQPPPEGLADAETPELTGRGIVALFTDPRLMEKSGTVQLTRQLARDYGFFDIDGTLPPLDKGL